MNLFDFEIIRPPFETSQKESLDWTAAAHVQSERLNGKEGEALEQFQREFEERLDRVGCKPDRIAKRGHFLADFLHRDWDKMTVYRLAEKRTGEGLDVRAKEFGIYADEIFEQFYRNKAAPDDLIHVTCTGYLSPSGAQKIVSKKKWGESTTVTHAYHMGCYGAFPAIRMGQGFLAADPEKVRVDVVHTEMCCLHINPSLHQTDQLVSQSLFADGFIKYSIGKEGRGLKVLALKEEIIPQSTKAMTWDVMDWGFQMSLAKEIPVLIARSLKGYLERLASKAKMSSEELIKKAHFAIHPGGPKILLHVQDGLKLAERQMEHSFQILRNYGNMSSGTIPHIWKAILDDPFVPDGTPIVSMAFGPGLSISGAILVKQCG